MKSYRILLYSVLTTRAIVHATVFPENMGTWSAGVA